jgi:hypothetical protein
VLPSTARSPPDRSVRLDLTIFRSHPQHGFSSILLTEVSPLVRLPASAQSRTAVHRLRPSPTAYAANCQFPGHRNDRALLAVLPTPSGESQAPAPQSTITLQVSGWKPSPENYFVYLDHPAPELITYRTSDPLQLGRDNTNKVVVLRTSHVLQYRVRDFDDLKKVTVRSPQLGERHPLSCADAFAWAQKQGTVSTQELGAAGEAARKRMERMRAEFRCSSNPVSALFFGVGLPDSEHDTQPWVDHALTFYNKNLLGAFPNAAGIEQHRLLDANVQVCGTGAGGTRCSSLPCSATPCRSLAWFRPHR